MVVTQPSVGGVSPFVAHLLVQVRTLHTLLASAW